MYVYDNIYTEVIEMIPLVGIGEIAKIMGVSEVTIRRIVKDENSGIPYYRPSDEYKFNPNEVLNWAKKKK